ncbi:hypothetical protein [Deinococcus reticulitermitis]|uniref:hypothetical protein n=1 Tax=Deinococcus reticulitermitis TaxID=856736 RepID=UPI001FDEB5EE|nr:hypothetical protein [Deinococcus reticulitermitis]
MRRALTLAALLTGLGAVPSGGASPAQGLELRLSYGGAVARGQISLGRADALTGVWSSVGRARLLRCAPRCVTVKDLPFNGLLALSESAGYRVALGGEFRAGQRVALTLRFRSGEVLNLSARVAR